MIFFGKSFILKKNHLNQVKVTGRTLPMEPEIGKVGL